MRNSSRKTSQWIVAGVLIVGGMTALWYISQILNTQGGALALGDDRSGVQTSIIQDRTRAASPEMSWINNAADVVERLETKVANLETALNTANQQDEIRREQDARETDKLLGSYENKILQLEQELASIAAGGVPNGVGRGITGVPVDPRAQANKDFSLKNGVNTLGEFLTPSSAVVPRNPLGDIGRTRAASPTTPASVGSGGTEGAGVQPFARDFALAVSEDGPGDQIHPKHLNEYLPAGSYAPAVVLSGVDASTGVTSQADPIPVIFRITAPAVTAGTRSTRGHTIDLTGCTVTGSARGDLSSERVYVRLLKLSCVQPGKHVFERDVAGYMSGAGKAGARGLVVSREGPMVRNAGIAGALAGLAEGVSSIGEAGAGADEASFNEALRGAGAATAAGGISGAADRLSEYYIERAEQYQPVVSLYGGTNVELVFLEGVDLG